MLVSVFLVNGYASKLQKWEITYLTLNMYLMDQHRVVYACVSLCVLSKTVLLSYSYAGHTD